MAQAGLVCVRHFREGASVTIGNEHRIITESSIAARRPNEMATDVSLELLNMSIRPSDTNCAAKPGPMRRGSSKSVDILPDAGHCRIIIATVSSLCPIRTVDTGLATECIDTEAAIVGHSRSPEDARSDGLQSCISVKILGCFVRSLKAKFGQRQQFDRISGEQPLEFPQLAVVQGGDDNLISRQLAQFTCPLRQSGFR